ncbi:hypothetical protein BGW80DRAFT_657533 [Lactifluus volemus]|nr:hypothetical protein BGW80DRAFT_657533 [Lactifluus volemus]
MHARRGWVHFWTIPVVASTQTLFVHSQSKSTSEIIWFAFAQEKHQVVEHMEDIILVLDALLVRATTLFHDDSLEAKIYLRSKALRNGRLKFARTAGVWECSPQQAGVRANFSLSNLMPSQFSSCQLETSLTHTVSPTKYTFLDITLNLLL